MKRASQVVGLILLTIAIPYTLQAQATRSRDTGCKECHACEIPTKLDPCLKECPRGQMVTAHHSADVGPVDIVLDNIAGSPDVYEPTRFAHRSHAAMAEMSGGCAQCHHYNLTGVVLACRTCHTPDAGVKNADLSKPGLKGAYHRQCANCHRELGMDTKCNGSCHQAKSSIAPNPAAARIQRTSTLVRPDRYVFNSGYEDGKVVTFGHNDHAGRFGLACASCHVNEPCAKCHVANAAAKKPVEHLEGGHDRCSACHDVSENCDKCHDKKPRASFNHERKTKFDLGRFHSALACVSCHKDKSNYKGLSATCTTCHAGWKPGSFEHAVTGIKLSETHESLDCESCHLESNFRNKPACSGCHDDKSYPASLPGARIQRAKMVKR